MRVLLGLAMAAVAVGVAGAQQDGAKTMRYTPTPGFDLSSIDTTANPCDDFYKFACGKFAANHPIPPDQSSASGFSNLFNVNTEELSGILEKAAAGDAGADAERAEDRRLLPRVHGYGRD